MWCSFVNNLYLGGKFGLMRIYELYTQWITLSVLFFIVEYNMDLLHVVTLGGLVAGSFLMGGWAVLQDRLGVIMGQRMNEALGSPVPKEDPRNSGNALPELVHKVFTLLGMLIGLQLLPEILPGYTLEINGILVACVFAYGLISVKLGKILYSQKSE